MSFIFADVLPETTDVDYYEQYSLVNCTWFLWYSVLSY